MGTYPRRTRMDPIHRVALVFFSFLGMGAESLTPLELPAFGIEDREIDRRALLTGATLRA